MKRFIFFAAGLVFAALSVAQPVDLSKYKLPVKVACIGNSITYGAGLDNIPLDSYPAQLGRMLGENWLVKNFGVSGRTLLKKGDLPYLDVEAFAKAKSFLPDIVIIKLGTNDTKPQNWKYSNEFLQDYRDLVDEFKSLSSHPKIYLCKPVPACKSRWGINDSILVNGVIPVIEQLAKEENLPVIDLYSALQGKASLFPDNIHPNAEGAGLIAKEIYKVLIGKEGQAVSAVYPGRKSEWHGFARYDFELDGRECHIKVPEKAAPGNPWVWRARFPGWHYEMDSLLILKGFYVAYINTDGMFGSPNAMEIWNQFYNYLTICCGLNKKVALEGVSRGGLFVYGFAKRWPERVSCIYAEAPVCDFKSWPGGKGAGKGEPASWEKLISEYNFASEKEALAYGDNPVNNLEKLAAAKVPVFHSIGLNDSVVPPDENTYKLINAYIRLGGPATVYPNTHGKQSLQGHHFPIDDIRAGADFILRSYPESKNLLDSRNYHIYRNNLQNARIEFERGKKGRVAFLGGSITFNPGWRDSICTFLQKRFPDTQFEFIAAGIPSMGSTPDAFRLERDVLGKGKIDLLFMEAAVNDRVNGRTNEEQIRAMEGIARHARESNPSMDIVFMYFADPEKNVEYNKGIVPPEIQNHEKVAEHYKIPSINLAREVAERIGNGEFSWEKDFIDLHPSPFGQQVYSRSIKSFLEDCWQGDIPGKTETTVYPLPEQIDNASYSHGILIPSSEVKPGQGWKLIPNWTPSGGIGTRPDFTKVPMLVSEKPGSMLNYVFAGNAVGIAVAAGPDAGTINYRIDNGEWETKDLFTSWSASLHLPWFYTLAAGLGKGQHRLELKINPGKNNKSTGNACRIRYFFINTD